MKTLFKSVIILTGFSILTRALGFVFKIYLSRELGAESMGIYQIALSVFFVLLTLTSSGVPLVISRVTATHINKRAIDRHSIATGGLVVSVAIGILICATIMLFRGWFESITNPLSTKLLILLLPAVLASAVYSSLKGNLWGYERYTIMSLLEIAEQIARIALCVIMFALGFEKLTTTASTFSIACIFSALLCIIIYFVKGGRLHLRRKEVKYILMKSTPITMVRTSNSAVNMIIAVLVPFLLMMSGSSSEQALYIFGSTVGMAFPLLYIPITITGSLAFALIPTLSSNFASGNMQGTKRQVEQAVNLSFVVACIFLPIFYALGEPICSFLYDNSLSGKFLSSSAWLLIPLSIENISSSIMNSLGLEVKGFINYIIGSIIMLIILLLNYSSFQISHLTIALGSSLVISTLLDLLDIKKKIGFKFSFVGILIKCLILVVPTTILTMSIYSLTSSLHEILRLGISSGCGLVFFAVLAVVLNIIKIDFWKKGKGKKKSTQKVNSTS